MEGVWGRGMLRMKAVVAIRMVAAVVGQDVGRSAGGEQTAR